MNIQPKPETLVPQEVTTGPLPGSRKIYHRALGREDILVPFREIALDPSANEPPVRVYDASGPYRKKVRISICPPVCRAFARPGSRAATTRPTAAAP